MSRQRQLLNKLVGQDETWLTGLCIVNIPNAMLDNDYIRSLCAVVNGTMAEVCNENEASVRTFDISRNK